MLDRTLVRIVLFGATLTPGCYASHERVDVERCAPAGVHSVETTVVSATPGCGLAGMGGLSEVTIPPTAESFFGGGSGEIVMVGPCRWEVRATEVAPDLTASIEGWIDTSDGTVRAAFDLELSGIGGVCRTSIEWSEPE